MNTKKRPFYCELEHYDDDCYWVRRETERGREGKFRATESERDK